MYGDFSKCCEKHLEKESCVFYASFCAYCLKDKNFFGNRGQRSFVFLSKKVS